MAAVMIVDPKELKKARKILGFTQIQAGIALGNVRPETVSRWERTLENTRPKIRKLHVETTQQFTEIANLLVELFSENEDRGIFLNTPQQELDEKSPYDTIMQDPPNGLRDVASLLGRMANGIPS